jgi:low affinity Fe/Cu permease
VGPEPSTTVARPEGAIVQHPADRTEANARGQFEDLAERTSFFASSRIFFVLCIVIVLGWAAGLAFGASDRFVAAAAGLMSAVTLMLVTLLKNAELRSERAIQLKLDAIASSLLEDKRGGEEDSEEQLETAIGIHDEI